MKEPRVVQAPNRGPFTLDGTRTFLVGRARLAVIDPGPDVARHVRAVVSEARSAGELPDHVWIIPTHWHKDHAGAAHSLAEELLRAGMPGDGVRIAGAPPAEVVLGDGDRIETDEGDLVAVSTPGHAREHLAFHWPDGNALFVGDLLLGRGDTTWVGEYLGCVADYLASLDRIESVGVKVLYPAHGPSLNDVAGSVEAFRRHRHGRIGQVRRALEGRPGAGAEDLLDEVYGKGALPSAVRAAALGSIEAILEHLAGGGAEARG